MADVIDFIRETATYMVTEHPEIYSHELAVEEISTTIDYLREIDKSFCCVNFMSFLLIRAEEDGTEEFLFAKKSAGLVVAPHRGVVKAYAYDDDIQLPHILDGLDDDDQT